jgi:hypothetical protein
MPDSAVYGDFDEDGRIDVAYTTSTDRLRHVALNRGNGLFMPLPASAAIFNGGSLVLAASADMNRDGHLDLLYYTVNGVLGVSFGDGHGAFAPVILSFAAATTQRWVFDVNHDGIPDFIEALTAGGVRVAVGAADGKFIEGPIIGLYAGAPVPGHVVAGDFDGDGFIDVAYANGASGNSGIAYAWGTGDPAKFVIKTGGAGKVDLSTPLAVADIDGDGAADIVCGHNDVLHVVRSAKRVTTTTILSIPGMTAISSLLRLDINGDGRPDLAFGRDDSTVGVALANSSGGYAPALFASLTGSSGFTIVDIYGDGTAAIVATGGQQGLSMIPVTAFGSGIVGASRRLPVDDLFRLYKTQVYDVDGDGHKDVILFDSYKPTTEVLFGDGFGQFHPSTPKTYADTYASITEIVGDFDGNGSADLALSSHSAVVLPATIEFDNDRGVFGLTSMIVGVDEFLGLLHTGPKAAPALLALRGTDLGILTISPGRNSQFTVIAPLTPGSSLRTADLDGDGVDEVMVSRGNVLHILKGPDAPWTEAGTIPSEFGLPYQFVVADLNGDGRLDLVGAFDSWCRVALLQADGSYSIGTYQTWGSITGIAVTDFDHDGIPDIVAATSHNNGGPGYLHVMRGKGDGTFENYATAMINEPVGGPSLMDVDGDGWDDILVGNASGIQMVRNVCVTPRVRGAALPSIVKAGQQSTLIVHALSTDGYAIGPVAIREAGKLLYVSQSRDAVTVWQSPPLTAGLHTYDIEYSDQFAGVSHTTITVTVLATPARRRAVH